MKTSRLALIGQTVTMLIGALALWACVTVQAQPVVSAIYPDGSVQFQATKQLSLTLSSADPAGIPSSSISVTLVDAHRRNLVVQPCPVRACG